MKRVIIVLMVAILATASQAAVVSYNFDNNGTVGGVGAGSGPVVGATAGVVSVDYWYNDWPSYPANDLIDNTGATTTIDISWYSFNTWSITGSHMGPDTDGSYNKEMLNGYLNSGPATWGPWTTESSVTLSQIVAEDISYDIYVYFSSDVAGREGYVTDGMTTYYFNTLGPASVTDASGNAVFIQAIETTEDGYLTAANYAVFSGLSGASQTLTVQMRDNDEWGGIAAIQIDGVVPEPATMLLLGLGGLLLGKRK